MASVQAGGTAAGGGLDDMSAMLNNLPEENDPVENWVILWQAILLCRALIKHEVKYSRQIEETDIVKLHVLALYYMKRIVFNQTEGAALQDCINERIPLAFVWKFMAFCENLHQFICDEQVRLYAQQQSQAPSCAELFASRHKAYIERVKRFIEVERAAIAHLETERSATAHDATMADAA